MDQRRFRGLNFFDSVGGSRLVAQTEQQCKGRQAERTAEYQVAPLLQIAWHSPGEADGNANALPRRPSCLGSSDWLNRPLAS